MMQLVCDGVVLDLNSGTSLSLEKTNPLFAFDNLKCERSLSFDLPDTATNNKVFRIAKNLAYDGDGMRKRYECEMRDGMVIKKGWLYITAYERGAYKAVFVTGQLLELASMRDAGHIWQHIDKSITAAFVGTPSNASRPASDTFACVKYRSNTDDKYALPSWRLTTILNAISIKNKWRVSLPSSSARAIIASANGARDEVLNFASTRVNTPASDVTIHNTLNPADMGYLVGTTSVDVQYTHTNPYVVDVTYRVTEFVALQNIKITFPKDFSDEYFLVSVQKGTTLPKFYGGYSFDVNRVQPSSSKETEYLIDGDPLAGRTVELMKGDAFILMQKSSYRYSWSAQLSGVVRGNIGYYLDGSPISYSFDVDVEGDEQPFGSTLRLYDNLPDWTFIDGCKYLAAITGTLLNYTQEAGLTFETLADMDAWPMVDLRGRVIAGGYNSARTFEDYQQHNTITFDSNEGVIAGSRLSVDYELHNDYLKAEYELMKIPLSEGNAYGADVTLDIELETDDDGRIFVRAGERPTLGLGGSGTETYLDRVQLVKNNAFARLVAQSTKTELSAYMSILEYERITAKTLILHDGVLYVWTSAQWSKGVAKFSLQKK